MQHGTPIANSVPLTANRYANATRLACGRIAFRYQRLSNSVAITDINEK